MLALDFLEMSEGLVLATCLNHRTGIPRETLRKPEISLSQRRIDKANQYSIQLIQKELSGAGFDANEAEDWLSKHPAINRPGMLYSSIVFETQVNGVFEYPRTLEFARKLDELSSLLYSAREDGNIEKFKMEIKNSGFADPTYFAQYAGEMELTHPPMLEQFLTAHNWEEINKPLQTLTANSLFALLALWDVEFCPQLFPLFFRRPCFSLVLPRIDPKAIKEYGSIEKRRDMYWLPVRRLIGVVACMGEFIRSVPNRWPTTVPSVNNISTQVQLAGDPPKDLFNQRNTHPRDNMSDRSLINWRDGTKKFNRDDFVGLWWQLCSFQKSQCPDVPWPLFVAALFWNLLPVKINNTHKEISLVTDMYDAWWHRCNKETAEDKEISGLKDWPSCFKNV